MYDFKVSDERRQGKSELSMQFVKYAIDMNMTLCLGCSDPKIWYDRIKEEYPDVALRIDANCIYINEKKKPNG